MDSERAALEPAGAAGDFWSGLALAGLGAYIVAQARGWDYLGSDGPGPGFFPLWCGLAMVVLAAILIASSLRRGIHFDFSRPHASRVGRALASWLALTLAIAAFPILGFVLGYGLLAYFVAAAMCRRPPVRAAVLATACAIAFHVVFVRVLGIALPAGLVGF